MQFDSIRCTLAAFALLACASTPASAVCEFSKVAEMPLMQASNGHPMVSAEINGKPVFMLFDTGSNVTTLTREGARSQGLSVEMGQGYSYGVGGTSSNQVTEVDEFVLGNSRIRKTKLWVLGSASLGDEFVGLIGADYSMQMDLEVALADKVARMFRTSDCNNAYLGYWDKDAMEVPLEWPGSFDKRPYVTVELNGKPVRALIDTGANLTVIYRRTAAKAGVQVDPAKPSSQISGIGDHQVSLWSARFDFKLGDELLKNVKMTVMDERSESEDDYSAMILGQDWLRAHRVLFARSQKRLIYSYLGGKLFDSP